jgi:hypothetical protein
MRHAAVPAASRSCARQPAAPLRPPCALSRAPSPQNSHQRPQSSARSWSPLIVAVMPTGSATGRAQAPPAVLIHVPGHPHAMICRAFEPWPCDQKPSGYVALYPVSWGPVSPASAGNRPPGYDRPRAIESSGLPQSISSQFITTAALYNIYFEVTLHAIGSCISMYLKTISVYAKVNISIPLAPDPSATRQLRLLACTPENHSRAYDDVSQRVTLVNFLSAKNVACGCVLNG